MQPENSHSHGIQFYEISLELIRIPSIFSSVEFPSFSHPYCGAHTAGCSCRSMTEIALTAMIGRMQPLQRLQLMASQTHRRSPVHHTAALTAAKFVGWHIALEWHSVVPRAHAVLALIESMQCTGWHSKDHAV